MFPEGWRQVPRGPWVPQRLVHGEEGSADASHPKASRVSPPRRAGNVPSTSREAPVAAGSLVYPEGGMFTLLKGHGSIRVRFPGWGWGLRPRVERADSSASSQEQRLHVARDIAPHPGPGSEEPSPRGQGPSAEPELWVEAGHTLDGSSGPVTEEPVPGFEQLELGPVGDRLNLR